MIQGRITAKIYPDGSREEQAYDTAGRLIARTDAAGKVETRSYGLDNRLTKVGYPNGTPGVELTDDLIILRCCSIFEEENHNVFR